MEGYSRDGNVYQCYGARDGFDVKGLYEHQRDKLTDEIGKFIRYKERLLKLLPQGLKIRRYLFVVPKFESAKLVAHANGKVEDVIAAKLPYVADDFGICVWDRSDFEVERKKEESSLLNKLELQFAEVSPDEISNWTSANGSGAENLEWKIRACNPRITDTKMRALRDNWIRQNIRVANALTYLKSRSVPVWEHIQKLRRSREEHLALSLGHCGGPAEIVTGAAMELAAEIANSGTNLDSADSRTIADGIVSDWLQICSLLPREEDDE